ncbi:MAG: HAD-IIB family hydrolase [Oscillospiraceae bacterium]|nr:HAD-IIB family hydrolase [Oscillospiraceae bacterium]
MKITDISKIKLLAFDLDGTLTQHKSPLSPQARRTLDRLGERYRLVMVGAGMCRRIYEQMERYPIDIIGNYGMQRAVCDRDSGELVIVANESLPCDRLSVEERVTALREKFGYTHFTGDNVEYHSSGCVTFPVLGTKADIGDKLAFDPDRAKRRRIYPQVKQAFPEYTVFVGGSSSFDMAPAPYNKYYALDRYCKELGLAHDEVAYVGDDYGPGGNDESVYRSDFPFVEIDNYLDFPKIMEDFLK